MYADGFIHELLYQSSSPKVPQPCCDVIIAVKHLPAPAARPSLYSASFTQPLIPKEQRYLAVTGSPV